MRERPNDTTAEGAERMNGNGYGWGEDEVHDLWPEADMRMLQQEVLPPPAWPDANAFPGWWGEYIAQAAEARGCPQDFMGMSILAALAARLGNSRWAGVTHSWREPPALRVALVGAPSSNKTPGMLEAIEALTALENEANEDWEQRQKEHRTQAQEAKEVRTIWEGEVKVAVKDRRPPPMEPDRAQAPEAPQRRRMMSSEITVEKAARMSAANPRGLLLVRDELAGWFGSMDRYSSGGGGGDRAFWLQAHNGGGWQVDRVKDGENGVSVPHLLWGILGGIQPDRVASLLTSGDDDGLSARFLYCWPEKRRPADLSTEATPNRLLDALRRLETLPWQPPAPVVLPFTTAARAQMNQWRQEVTDMEEGASGQFLSWVGKLPGFAARLALVFAHMEWLCSAEGTPPPTEVNEEAMARACAFLAEYAATMARRVFGDAGLPQNERDARQLARWWFKRPDRPDTLNARELRRMEKGPGIGTADRITAALEELASAGWCRPAPVRAGDRAGRQRADWQMNPALMVKPS